tara:strand:+ start:877 stop:1269 length:393 start_codon:yes stop_codon:yes gene_type:complete
MSATACRKETCIIKFNSQKKYDTSLMIYKKGLSYIPKLISFDPKKKTITIEKRGISISKSFKSNKEKNEYIPKIKELGSKFKKTFGIFHNDLTYGNVLITPSGKLSLIDFEYASPKKRKFKNELRKKMNN